MCSFEHYHGAGTVAELRSNGMIAEKLEELNCELHADSILKLVTDDTCPVQYAACEPCMGSDRNWKNPEIRAAVGGILSARKLNSSETEYITVEFSGTAAYRCEPATGEKLSYRRPDEVIKGCGWVIGRPITDTQNVFVTEDDAGLPAREIGYATKYYCSACGLHIGTFDMTPRVVYGF